MKTQISVWIPLLAGLAVYGMEFLAAQETVPDYVVVSGFDVNLRTGPGTDRVVIGRADKGDLFVCTGQTEGWYEIRMFSDDPRYISAAHVYPLTRAQIVPGHRLRLPANESTARSLYASVHWALERSEVEASELLPASVDSARHVRLRNIRLDRMVLGFFQSHGEHGIQPAIYRALLDDMGAGRDTLPSVEEIVERYVEALGGREAIEQIRTRVMSGRLITDLPTWSPPVHEEVPIEIRAATSSGFLSIAQTTDGAVWDGYDGQVEWSRNEEGVTIRERPDVRFAWLADPQNALRMNEYFPDMRLRGSAEIGGQRMYVVDVDNERLHAMYFDTETALLVRLGYNRELGDYREVDGVLLPFRVSLSRKGGSSTYVFDSIEHNVEIDASQFVMPDTWR